MQREMRCLMAGGEGGGSVLNAFRAGTERNRGIELFYWHLRFSNNFHNQEDGRTARGIKYLKGKR